MIRKFTNLQVMNSGLKYLGWQGGTIHQVCKELTNRYTVDFPMFEVDGVHDIVEYLLLKLGADIE